MVLYNLYSWSCNSFFDRFGHAILYYLEFQYSVMFLFPKENYSVLVVIRLFRYWCFTFAATIENNCLGCWVYYEYPSNNGNRGKLLFSRTSSLIGFNMCRSLLDLECNIHFLRSVITCIIMLHCGEYSFYENILHVSHS